MIHIHWYRRPWRVVQAATPCDDGLWRRYEVAVCRCGKTKHRVSDHIVDRTPTAVPTWAADDQPRWLP
jgi:hypothetical protein